MIRGPNYVFLNIPNTGAEEIEKILHRYCEGQVVTPTHETLLEEVERRTKVFTVVRKPYHRAIELCRWYAPEEKPMDYLTWLLARDTLNTRPYSYWISKCTNVFKIEEINEKLPPFLLSIGYKIPTPEVNSPTFETTIEEATFIKEAFKDDFVDAKYSTDRRSKT